MFATTPLRRVASCHSIYPTELIVFFIDSDLQEGMMSFVQEAMGDADAILFVTDLFETEFSTTKVRCPLPKQSVDSLCYAF